MSVYRMSLNVDKVTLCVNKILVSFHNVCLCVHKVLLSLSYVKISVFISYDKLFTVYFFGNKTNS